MSRYKDAQCRVCRREGCKLFLKGERCYSDKCSVSRRNYAPGDHGQKNSKLSEYGTQLREKQKTKSYYGVGEKQFRKYFKMARRCDALYLSLAGIVQRRCERHRERAAGALARYPQYFSQKQALYGFSV